MSDSQPGATSVAPKHLMIVGVLALLWNGVGAYDYLMTQTENVTYMGKFTPEQLEFFYGFPTWVVATWAIAVWGGVLGAVLLLMRRKWATPVFLASLMAMVITAIQNYVLSNGAEVMGGAGPMIFTAVIFVISILLYFYSRKMEQAGVLA